MVFLRVPPFIPDLTAMTPVFFRARFNVRGAMPSARAMSSTFVSCGHVATTEFEKQISWG